MSEDRKARRFEALALPHLDAAYNFARWLTCDDNDARDVVHDAYLRALRSFDGFRGADMRPWLFTIVRNCFLTHSKRQGMAGGCKTIDVNAAVEKYAELTDENPGPLELLTREETRESVDRALALLPDAYREVIVLRELEELTYSEIAQVTGTPIGTVMSRLARGRRALLAVLVGERGDSP